MSYHDMWSLLILLSLMCSSCMQGQAHLDPIIPEDHVIEPRRDTSYHDLGVRPDCTEQGLTYQQLINIAENIDGNSPDPQQAFLDALPKGALQTFTLVVDSESAQSLGISPEWPGVIRMSQNGHLTIRYTCDRSVVKTYGKVEVIHFDPEAKRFGFTELNLMERDRVRHEPALCYGCHNIDFDTEDARPNWHMYPNWPGVLGSHDDYFPQGTAEEARSVSHSPGWLPPDHSQEERLYHQLIQDHLITQPDPCYLSLPWPSPWLSGDTVAETYQRYPYGMRSGHARHRLYALRPNLKFTEVYSKLLGQRNFRRLRQHPRYQELKVLLALEAASCDQRALSQQGSELMSAHVSRELIDDRLVAILPQYLRAGGESPSAVSVRGFTHLHHDPRHPESRAQALYGVWRAFDYEGGEWSLVPFQYHEPQYATGAGPGANQEFPADLPLTAYTQYHILVDVLGERDDLFTRSTGEAEDFGDHFSCIDEQGGAKVFHNDAAWQAACSELLALIESPPRGESPTAPPTPTTRRLPRPRGPNEPLAEYLSYLDTFVE